MFHNQKPTSTLTVHKNILGTSQHRSWILFHCNSYNKTTLILINKIFRNCTKTIESTEEYTEENLKCAFEVTEFQLGLEVS